MSRNSSQPVRTCNLQRYAPASLVAASSLLAHLIEAENLGVTVNLSAKRGGFSHLRSVSNDGAAADVAKGLCAW